MNLLLLIAFKNGVILKGQISVLSDYNLWNGHLVCSVCCVCNVRESGNLLWAYWAAKRW